MSFVFMNCERKLPSEKYSIPVDDVRNLTNAITNGATSARKERGEHFSAMFR